MPDRFYICKNGERCRKNGTSCYRMNPYNAKMYKKAGVIQPVCEIRIPAKIKKGEIGGLMTLREELFDKYHIDKSHSIWENEIDNWFSVEVCREVLGRLPGEKDSGLECAKKFLDDRHRLRKLLIERGSSFGSMYLTAKRMIYRYSK